MFREESIRSDVGRKSGSGRGWFLGGLAAAIAAVLPAPLQASGHPGGQSQSYFNPLISAIGDMAALSTDRKKPEEGSAEDGEEAFTGSKFEFREAEFGFQNVVDPFARLDVFTAFEEGRMRMEEGYATILSLPAGFQARAGFFRLSLGKQNRIHRPELLTFDRPAAIARFFGEEGLVEAGGSISWLPVWWPLGVGEWTLEVTNNSNEAAFAGPKDGRPLYLVRYRQAHDLSEETNLDMGVSWVNGENADSRLTQIVGADVTLRWKPLRRAIYHSFLLQGEFLFSRRGAREGAVASRGAYGLLQYQPWRRWHLGFRLDYSENPKMREDRLWAYQPYVTFALSEFSRFRLAWQHHRESGKRHVNTGLLQMTFSLGPHRPHAL